MKHNPEELLAKFWDGETSLEEENALKAYFRSGDIDQKHSEYADYFGWLDEKASVRYTNHDDGGEIDRLLNAYWEGESTLGDEKRLREYFAGNSIKKEHLAYAGLFQYFEDQRSVTFEAATLNPRREEAKVVRFDFKKVMYGTAAVFALAMGSLFVVKNLSTDQLPAAKTAAVYEVEDPEEAMRITREALAMVSSKFRQSQQHVKENMGALNKVAIFK